MFMTLKSIVIKTGWR